MFKTKPAIILRTVALLERSLERPQRLPWRLREKQGQARTPARPTHRHVHLQTDMSPPGPKITGFN
jgi:hypothetical protein